MSVNEFADRWPNVVTGETAWSEEFAQRLADSSDLAFRVAFSVLRHREDAEDVAQEAFLCARAALGQLRERDRFRAWLVRMTWRLALDRRRADQRRTARQVLAPTAAQAAPSTLEHILAQERTAQLWRAIAQ